VRGTTIGSAEEIPCIPLVILALKTSSNQFVCVKLAPPPPPPQWSKNYCEWACDLLIFKSKLYSQLWLPLFGNYFLGVKIILKLTSSGLHSLHLIFSYNIYWKENKQDTKCPTRCFPKTYYRTLTPTVLSSRSALERHAMPLLLVWLPVYIYESFCWRFTVRPFTSACSSEGDYPSPYTGNSARWIFDFHSYIFRPQLLAM